MLLTAIWVSQPVSCWFVMTKFVGTVSEVWNIAGGARGLARSTELDVMRSDVRRLIQRVSQPKAGAKNN